MTEKTATQARPARPAETRAGHGFRGWLVIVALSLLIGTLITTLERRGSLDSLNLQGYDLLVAVQSPEPPSSRIFNIDFDEESVEQYHAFPIPRLLLAE